MKLLKQRETDYAAQAFIHYIPQRGERDFLGEAIEKPRGLPPTPRFANSPATRETPRVQRQTKLPFLYIIETPAPYFNPATLGGGDDFCAAFRGALSVANERFFQSVSIGALSLGIGGYPTDLTVALLLQTEREWKRAHRKPFLQTVVLAVPSGELYDEIKHLSKVYSAPGVVALPKAFRLEALFKVERVLY